MIPPHYVERYTIFALSFRHKDHKKNKSLKNTSVIISAFTDNEYIILVKIEVREFNDTNVPSVYVSITDTPIKKDEVVVVSTQKESKTAIPSFEVSLTSLLQIIKSDYKEISPQKYIPSQFDTSDVADARKSKYFTAG